MCISTDAGIPAPMPTESGTSQSRPPPRRPEQRGDVDSRHIQLHLRAEDGAPKSFSPSPPWQAERSTSTSTSLQHLATSAGQVRHHHEEPVNHRGASDQLIWGSGDPLHHAALQPEKQQHGEDDRQHRDLAAQISPATPTTGHDGPYWHKATTSTPRPNNYSPAATPHPTPAG
jgi:hypothetical protein